MRLLISFIFILFASPAFAEISYKEVTATGSGMSYDEALNNALSEAITMVNGKNVQTRTVITTMSGNQSQDERDIEALGEFFETLAIAAAVAEGKNVPKKNTSDSGNEPEYTQNYLKEMIDETKGGIKSYKVIKQYKNNDGRDVVKVRAEVAVFNLPKESMRTRIAVLPFNFYNVEGDVSRFNRLLTQGINDYLVQTKKFTVLDRDFVNEVANEKRSILDGSAPAIEMAKIGNEISADFILSGNVEDFYKKTVTKTILATGDEVSKDYAFMYLSYRLIDVATKQISFSNTIKTLTPLSSDQLQADSDMTEKVSQSLGQEILFSTYPVQVENVKGVDIYLGMGGKQFQKGQIYEIFEKGDQIIDSYTNEVLGNTETLVGQVEITSVSSNYSKAKLLNEKNIMANFEPGSFIIRPVQVDEEANKKIQLEKAKKKIEEKRKENEEALSDEW